MKKIIFLVFVLFFLLSSCTSKNLDDINLEISTIYSKIEAVNLRVDQTEENISEYEDRINTLEEKNEEFKKQNEELRTAIDSLQSYIKVKFGDDVGDRSIFSTSWKD